MKRILKQLLFAAIITICASFAAFAQSKDDKKTPPKDKPPIVVVKPKDGEKPKGDKPKNDDGKSKKPQSETPSDLQLIKIMFN